jgi:tight adherence protein C
VLFLVLALSLLGTSVFLVAEVATASSRQRSAAVRRAARYGQLRRPGIEQARFRERVLSPAIGRLASLALRLNPRTTVESVEARLLNAGLSRTVSPSAFLAAKAGFALLGGFFGFALGGALGAFALGLLLAGFGAFAGFVAPGGFLTFKVRGRREAIRSQLPDALDLLAVSVEAGLGFDGAISKLTEHLDGPLIEELMLTLSEMRVGESRHDALKKLAERTSTPEVGHFTRAIIQADQLGISLGRILRVQATDTRDRRQAAAEEKAMKAPIKMLFPTVLFIFPAMFIVILGPALMHLSKVF